jgi:hypothetical protein
MKKTVFFMVLAVLMSAVVYAQPQGFSYQTIVRDNTGDPITNKSVKFRFTIKRDSSAVYVQTNTATTNDFGLVNLVIGQGTVVSGHFADIDWGDGSVYSLKVELDLQDGHGYRDMGTSPFTSVPYALSTKGFTTTVSGAAGNTGEIQFNENDNLGASSLLEWNDTIGSLGIGGHAQNGRLVIQASSSAIDSVPLFEVKDKAGKTVFAVYNNSVHVFVDKEAKKRSYGAYKGGFVISGKNSGAQAANNNDIMLVNADSTRIFTQDERAGFGVVGISAKRGTSAPYMHMTPENYFVGENSGQNIETGRYNSTYGFETGKNLTDGDDNVFLGYQAGYSNTYGFANNFLGRGAGYSNDSGSYNNFIGRETGYSNTTGYCNNFFGDQVGYSNTTGSSNNFIGDWAGYSNTTGSYNNFIGDLAGYSNTTGSSNNFIGDLAGFSNTTGESNNFFGYDAGYSNTFGFGNN